MKCVGQRHLAEFVMMAVGFAVGGDVHQLATLLRRRESPDEAFGEVDAVVEQALESDRLGDGAVVEKQGDGPGRSIRAIGAGGIDARAAHVGPRLRADLADGAGLRRGENGEADSLGGENVEGFQIDGGLREPHALRRAAEAGTEIGDAPKHLGPFVAGVGQRHDGVVINLGHGRAVSAETFAAGGVGGENRLVRPGGFFHHPGEQRGSDVEADAPV